MSEKSKVKSFIRKGKIVKSFDRRKNKKKLILSSIVGVGLLGAGTLTLKKKLASNVSRSVSRATVLPSNTIQHLPHSTASQASVLRAYEVSTPNILSSMNVTPPTNLPKVIRRKKTPVLNNQNPKSTVISANVLEKRQPTKNPTQTMIKHQKEVNLDPEIPLLYQATAKMNNNMYFPDGPVKLTKKQRQELQAENRKIKEMKILDDNIPLTSNNSKTKRNWGKKKKEQ